ncbi:MAG: hypothetical protein DWQ09_00415 [Proteobacteria bacterium]|nr:MAG: hypothetical protein DWQ09_00415 [Pseudomonadota bacterium]
MDGFIFRHLEEHSMTNIEYLTVGQYDFFEKVEINDDGHFTVESGSYKSKRPRSGLLTTENRKALDRLVEDLPQKFSNVNGDRSFAARLTVDSDHGRREYWIHPSADRPPALGQLVNFIRAL